MSKVDDDPSLTAARDAARRFARSLKLFWSGVGEAELTPLAGGRSFWRVYDDCWGVGGGHADIDAATGALIHIQESVADRPSSLVIPSEFVPDDRELVTFAAERLGEVGWSAPGLRVSLRADLECHWELRADTVVPAIRVDVGGRRGNLHIKQASRR